jgi:hypothetical protein
MYYRMKVAFADEEARSTTSGKDREVIEELTEGFHSYSQI